MRPHLHASVRIQRAIRVAPLYEYLRNHGIRLAWVQKQVNVPHSRFYQIESGQCLTPPTFIEDVCRVIAVPVTTIYPDWPNTSDTAA
jgi:hypothetical protein